jgi:hypothetical protein
MRRPLRVACAALPLAVLLPAGLASADTMVDADTIQFRSLVDFGVVCPGVEDPSQSLALGLKRTGNGNVFADDQILTVGSTAQAPVSVAAPSTLSIMPEAITLEPTPSVPVWHWNLISSNQQYVQWLTPEPVLTLGVPDFTPGAIRVAQTRTVSFTVSGRKFGTTGTLMLFRTAEVRYTLGSTDDCAAADTVDPTISLGHGAPDGLAGWFVTDPVAVTVTASDNVGVDHMACTENGSPIAVVAGQLTVTGEGTHDLACTAYDAAGNDATATDTVRIDTVAPEVALAGSDGVTVDFGDPLPAYSCTADDATSGLAGPCTVTGDGDGAVGTHVVTATATDVAGHTSTATATYTVRAWTLDGFYRPVDKGLLNTVKAGSTVPLKFNVLKGDPGVPLTSGIGASFAVHAITCDSGADLDAIEELSTTGNTVLRWTGDQWIQNWATPRSGAGKCFRVTLTTADGSSLSAQFKLT